MFIFFGLVAVAGTAYLQALRFDGLFLVVSVPPGALITAILVVNNLRDIPTDTAAGKRTLAVVMGKRRTQAEYGALLGTAYFVPAHAVPRVSRRLDAVRRGRAADPVRPAADADDAHDIRAAGEGPRLRGGRGS